MIFFFGCIGDDSFYLCLKCDLNQLGGYHAVSLKYYYSENTYRTLSEIMHVMR